MKNRHQCFSAIARSVMISATAFVSTLEDSKGFSAIARSVMISAEDSARAMDRHDQFQCYSS